ncbi:MAG: dihydroorotase [Bacteroidales bacterium]|nr:dihydroorotase [Bacteroidales bacterium]
MPLLAGLKHDDETLSPNTVSFAELFGITAFRYLIKNAFVVNEGSTQRKSVLVENGRIAKIADEIPATEGVIVIDADGKYLLPGVIDTHVHFRDPGLTHKADFYTESCAAVAGGVTSVIDMPNTKPQTTTEALLDEKIAMASAKSLCNFGFMVGATNDNIDTLNTIDTAKYAAIKLFMGSSTGNMLVSDDTALERLFQTAKKPIVAHCEDEARIAERTAIAKERWGDNTPASAHAFIRDDEACFRSTHKAVGLAQHFGSRLHVAHVTTAKELSLFSDGSIDGKRITAEVTPSHLWFCDENYPTLGNRIRCNPAVKSSDDREALRKALNDGILDTIATDHAPHLLEEKMKPYFESVSGMPSIQHSLLVALELCKLGYLSLEKVVEKMCHNPAKLFGIEERGFVREGYNADLVLVDLNAETVVDNATLYYKCRWSPLEGTRFHAKVEKTFVNGVLTYDCQRGIVNDVKGRPLRF